MLFLSDDDVRQVLSMDDAIEAVTTAFVEAADPASSNFLRRRMYLDTTRFNILGGALASTRRAAVKVYAGGGEFWVMLFDEKGRLLATISSRFASLYRTGAATGVATQWLSRKDSVTLGILGTGVQATAQVEAIARVRPLQQVRAWSPTPEHVAAFASRMSEVIGVEVVAAAGPQEAVRDMDVVVTATKSFNPVLEGSWLAPGAHVNLMGANQIHRREAHESVFARSDLVTVDDREQAGMESGDILAAIDAKIIRWHDVVELHEVVGGRIEGRSSAEQVTLFKSLGVGIWDVAISSMIYDRAKAQGLGTEH